MKKQILHFIKVTSATKGYSAILLLLMLVFGGNSALAAITVTPGSGGTNICSTHAVGGSSPSFTTLGNITVTEGAAADISAGTRTLILTAPAGWQFSTAATPTYTFTPSRNITSVASGAPTATTLTVTVNVVGTGLADAFSIIGLQVQATSTGSASGNITASSAFGFAGITTGTTNFGSLSLTAALTPSVATAASATTICAGITVTFNATPTNGGAPTYQWMVNGAPVAGATSSSYVTNTLANGNTIFVTMTPTGCVTLSSVNSNTVTMTVNSLPTTVTVTPINGVFCNSVTLTASNGGDGTIYYEAAKSGGTSTATPSTSQTVSLPGTYTYYFRARSAAGCWGAEGSAKVTINTPPSTPTITPTSATVCPGSAASFTATATASATDILTEDFNSGAPAWTITNTGGVALSYWQIRNSPGYNAITVGDGTPMMEAASDATGSGITTKTIVTSPSFSLANYTSATVSFNQFYQVWPAGDTTVAVEYSIDGGATWAVIVDEVGATTGTTTWASTAPTTTLAIPAAAIGQPDVRLRWNYVSQWGWYWAIDNIAVRGTPQLIYTWAGLAGATGLSCTTCANVDITPTTTGANNYSVTTDVAGCTATNTVTVTVNSLPAVFNVTGGGTTPCGGGGTPIGLSGSEAGVNYQLYNGAASMGGPVAGTGSAISFGSFSVAGTYTAVATNATTLCTVNMTSSATVTLSGLPIVYAVTGGGPYCGSGSIPVGISGSNIGVTYQLYNGSTPVGSPVAGIGFPFNFGTFSAAGTYTVRATDASGICTSDMSGSAVIAIYTPPAIFSVTGSGAYCPGGAGAPITLSNSQVGVNYQLYNGSTPVGLFVGGTGSALTLGPAMAAGTYTVLATNATSSCTSNMAGSAIITIGTAAAPITGITHQCPGSASTLSDATTGGTWSSGSTGIATVGATTGIINGVATGTAIITYTPPAGCSVTVIDTVLAAPVVSPITGTANICVGATSSLSSATTGGVWSSSASGIASVGAATGILSGVAAGTATITYTVGSAGCAGIATITSTINAYPVLSAITGPTGVCVPGTATLSNTVAGGTWTSGSTSAITIDPVTGIATGVAAGTSSITYAVTSGPGCTSTVTRTETASTPPTIAAITGPINGCVGSATVLTDSTTGGTWSSSNTAIATVGSTTGIITGVTTGVVTITYTVTNSTGCTAFVTQSVTIGAALPSASILPASASITMCDSPVTLSMSTAGTGLSYQWMRNGTPIAGATNTTYTTGTAGSYSAVISNGTCSTIITGPNVLAAPIPVISYNAAGGFLFTGTFATYQWYWNGTPITGATSSGVVPPGEGSYIVVVSDSNGCARTSAAYVFTINGVRVVNAEDIKVYPNPASTTLFIDAAIPVKISVLSPDGKILMKEENAKTINVHQLANGIYMLMIYDERNILIKTQKFSKLD